MPAISQFEQFLELPVFLKKLQNWQTSLCTYVILLFLCLSCLPYVLGFSNYVSRPEEGLYRFITTAHDGE